MTIVWICLQGHEYVVIKRQYLITSQALFQPLKISHTEQRENE